MTRSHLGLRNECSPFGAFSKSRPTRESRKRKRSFSGCILKVLFSRKPKGFAIALANEVANAEQLVRGNEAGGA